MSEERIPREEIKAERRRFIRERMLLTIQDAAELLAVGERTVERMLEDGRLTRVNDHKNAGKTRITAASIDMYITSITEK